ncbi:MAG: ribonuclease III [Brockia lithotrophica]|nr:ribonuclease III [Brockia lithotrophica]
MSGGWEDPTPSVDALLERLAAWGIAARDRALFREALTHASYAHDWEETAEAPPDNERLEFLGDAVLELLVSEFLFHLVPPLSEGEMTKLRAQIVREESLVLYARELGLQEYLLLGRSEEFSGGRERPSILADAFEAVVGAVYLDAGLEAARRLLDVLVFPRVKRGEFRLDQDYKSLLQEIVQRFGTQYALSYEIVEESGPAHNRRFVAVVLLNGREIGRGAGRSKKEAEQQAAREALERVEAYLEAGDEGEG